jgi:hypothetical protein
LRLMMPPLPGAESGREPRFPQALVWLWCSLGVALVWLCTPESMPSICLQYGLGVALGGFGRPLGPIFRRPLSPAEIASAIRTCRRPVPESVKSENRHRSLT